MSASGNGSRPHGLHSDIRYGHGPKNEWYGTLTGSGSNGNICGLEHGRGGGPQGDHFLPNDQHAIHTQYHRQEARDRDLFDERRSPMQRGHPGEHLVRRPSVFSSHESMYHQMFSQRDKLPVSPEQQYSNVSNIPRRRVLPENMHRGIHGIRRVLTTAMDTMDMHSQQRPQDQEAGYATPPSSIQRQSPRAWRYGDGRTEGIGMKCDFCPKCV